MPLGDPWAQSSHSWSSSEALQWHLFTDKKSSALLTHGESDTQGAAASNSWAEIPSRESAGPWASEGPGTWGARLRPGG